MLPNWQLGQIKLNFIQIQCVSFISGHVNCVYLISCRKHYVNLFFISRPLCSAYFVLHVQCQSRFTCHVKSIVSISFPWYRSHFMKYKPEHSHSRYCWTIEVMMIWWWWSTWYITTHNTIDIENRTKIEFLWTGVIKPVNVKPLQKFKWSYKCISHPRRLPWCHVCL